MPRPKLEKRLDEVKRELKDKLAKQLHANLVPHLKYARRSSGGTLASAGGVHFAANWAPASSGIICRRKVTSFFCDREDFPMRITTFLSSVRNI